MPNHVREFKRLPEIKDQIEGAVVLRHIVNTVGEDIRQDLGGFGIADVTAAQ